MMRSYSYGSPYASPGGMMGGGGWLALLLMLGFGLLVLIGIILLVVWAVRAAAHQAPPGISQHQGDPMDVARRRLASGEITTEQFEEIRRTLGG